MITTWGTMLPLQQKKKEDFENTASTVQPAQPKPACLSQIAFLKPNATAPAAKRKHIQLNLKDSLELCSTAD